MRYSSESKVEKVVRWISKTVLKLIVLALVLLVTVQFILTNSSLEKSLISKVPYSKYILDLGQQNKFSQAAKTVSASKKGTLVFQLQGADDVGQVRLLVNEKVVGDFAAGSLKVKVEPGDELAVDTRGCQEGVWLRLSNLSKNIDFFQEGQQFWLKNEYKSLGIVKSKTKF
ncbi:MAG: hypothetical protein R6V17_05440 [Halanaerobacter sp.]